MESFIASLCSTQINSNEYNYEICLLHQFLHALFSTWHDKNLAFEALDRTKINLYPVEFPHQTLYNFVVSRPTCQTYPK
jgi:hypothetical protein